MTDEERRHAVVVIDMPSATNTEVQDIVRALRQSATASDNQAWPDEFAILVDDAADELSMHVNRTLKLSGLPASV